MSCRIRDEEATASDKERPSPVLREFGESWNVGLHTHMFGKVKISNPRLPNVSIVHTAGHLREDSISREFQRSLARRAYAQGLYSRKGKVDKSETPRHQKSGSLIKASLDEDRGRIEGDNVDAACSDVSCRLLNLFIV